MTKRKLYLFICVVLFFAGIVSIYIWNRNIQISKIDSYEECIKLGLPVPAIYPGICTTPDGRTFREDIGNELEYSDLIHLDNPRPNAKVTSPLKIIGSARGTWFWEANSTAELYDMNGKSIGFAHVIAEGEWMSEKFVPFEGMIDFTSPQTSKGKLILRNDNPSGLPENQKELIVPVRF